MAQADGGSNTAGMRSIDEVLMGMHIRTEEFAAFVENEKADIEKYVEWTKTQDDFSVTRPTVLGQLEAVRALDSSVVKEYLRRSIGIAPFGSRGLTTILGEAAKKASRGW